MSMIVPAPWRTQFVSAPSHTPASNLTGMATPPCTPRELVDRLDARHDELIAKLDELNAQIEAVLAEFNRSREPRAEEATTRRVA